MSGITAILLAFNEEVAIGVRYDVDVSSEHPIKYGVKLLVKVPHDMEFKRHYNRFTE